MASKTEICNMTLSHLGIGSEIANVDTERSSEAQACRRFFDECRNATLEDYNWSFARKFATLNLVEETPIEDWLYSYRYPVDCVRARRILSGSPDESRQDRINFIVGKDSAGRLIYTNQETAELEYTEKVTDPSFYPSAFSLALSFRLAAYCAPRLTKGDPFKLKAEMLVQYELEINRAERNDVNSQQDFEEAESAFIRARS